MGATPGERSALIEWGVAGRPLAGQAVSGDMHLIAATAGGVLVAVIDGLGHGQEAGAAAAIAVATLRCHAEEPVIALVERCHECLRGTRGAVMSLAAFDGRQQTLTWLGVGNVECMLLRADTTTRPARESAPLRGGVVGDRLPPLRAATLPVAVGDTLALATDGLASDFVGGVTLGDAPQRIADRTLARYARGTDDALVLIARYLGDAR